MRSVESGVIASGARARMPPETGNRADFLARGELDERDRRELADLKDQIRRDSGLACHDYKESYLRRRLAVRLRACDLHDYGEYGRRLREDPMEYVRLRSQFTIHVSRFFRNPRVWAAVRKKVVPELFDRDERSVRVWSAGVANGEEAYSIAMLLHDYARETGRVMAPDRFDVLGTDIDEAVLEAGARAEYNAAALAELPAALRERWFECAPRLKPREEVRKCVRFRRIDLLTEDWPRRQHLILCRNVLIYVNRTVQPTFLSSLFDALLPGGYLVLGRVEPLLGPAAAKFRTVDNVERIYQRP